MYVICMSVLPVCMSVQHLCARCLQRSEERLRQEFLIPALCFLLWWLLASVDCSDLFLL